MPKRNAKAADPIASDLADIKRLLVFALLRNGASQGEVASALGVKQSTVSRMFPGGLRDAVTKGGKKPRNTKR